ncbi:MAG: RNA polymerase sigma factor [Pirellulales bacterium]
MCDNAALDRLVLEHLSGALRFATRLTGDADAAEEVVQEALAKVAGGWAAFRGEAAFRTWLFRIVLNVFRDRRRPPTVEPLADDLGDSRAIDPASAAMAGELGTLIARHVSSLPARQREVLVLVAYEGFSTSEVAAAVGISEANVHSTLHAARNRLKRQLAAYLAER